MHHLEFLSRLTPGKTVAAKRSKAIATFARLVGALVMARGVNDQSHWQENAGRRLSIARSDTEGMTVRRRYQVPSAKPGGRRLRLARFAMGQILLSVAHRRRSGACVSFRITEMLY